MKIKLIILFVFALGMENAFGQEIIPFPNIGDSRMAIVNETGSIDDHNYSLYTREYQEALMDVDVAIEEMENSLLREKDQSRKAALEVKMDALQRKRSELLSEADLVEDLNKFY